MSLEISTTVSLSESPDHKESGAYYTPEPVVRFLTDWATEGTLESKLLDPTCGDGRFLDGYPNATGIDSDPRAIATASQRLPLARLVESEFFQWAGENSESFDAVAGNPPFIRYQRFSGSTRTRAREYCKQHGVSLSSLASSWASFIIGASTKLRRGGRLAFVVPAEIGHASYAKPVLAYLLRSFGRLEIIAIRDKLFPSLSEDCWLLRASEFGRPSTALFLTVIPSFPALNGSSTQRVVTTSDLAEFDFRLRPFLLPDRILSTYRELVSSDASFRLGEVASLGIGYVTGANSFFHLKPSTAAKHRIPEDLLRPAIRSNRDLNHPDITPQVVQSWWESDRPYLLLDLTGVDQPPEPVQSYLDSPPGLAARQAYKCRVRSPWYRVPDVKAPDAFLQLMSSRRPRLVLNSSGCVCTNSVHSVHVKDRERGLRAFQRWGGPITTISCEIEGRVLGGGMLKLEPADARRIAVSSKGLIGEGERALLEEGVRELRKWRHLRDA